MLESFRVTNLERVRLLADPLKLRIIQCIAEGRKTTRDLAGLLRDRLED